jgi:hypothetical protein
MALNLTSKEEGREKNCNVNLVPSSWTYPYLWGVVSPCTAKGQLNVMGGIIANSNGLVVNKMQDQGMSRTECWKRVKAVND